MPLKETTVRQLVGGVAVIAAAAGIVHCLTRPERSLWQAVERGDVAKVKEALARGANVNATTGNDWTPLHSAAEYGHADVVKLLLAEGADVNTEECELGMTPLHWAAFFGHPDVAKLLIAKGANVDPKNKEGYTPLRLAEERGHAAAAALLKQHGAEE